MTCRIISIQDRDAKCAKRIVMSRNYYLSFLVIMQMLCKNEKHICLRFFISKICSNVVIFVATRVYNK